MDSIRKYTLGEAYPASPHAVVSSLPTLADVCAYEEKDARVLDAMRSGYPRFVVHAYITELIRFYLDFHFLEGRAAVIVPNRRSARDLIEFIDESAVILELENGLSLIHFDSANEKLCKSILKYLQHTGCGISSRQAEDLLIQNGLLDTRHKEAVFEGNALQAIESEVAALVEARPTDVLVCTSGMNAFFAAFRAVQEFQKPKGRTKWLQLGWLYLDTGCILEGFLSEGESLEKCYDLGSLDCIIERIYAAGDSLSAVVVECPTNPLIQVCDLRRISAAVQDCGGVLIVDPSIASIYNISVLSYADILVCSLTKYASHEGDVMSGVLALNPQSQFYGDLVLRTSRYYCPPYQRDISRLAFHMERARPIVEQMNTNAQLVVDFLRSHPAVEAVYYAPDSPHYSQVEKNAVSGGAVVSFVLKGSMERFYDALDLLKGPSFGTRFSLISSFMYLAHYDLVTTTEGRAFLEEVGIAPDLLRLSVGIEPVEELISALEKAFNAM